MASLLSMQPQLWVKILLLKFHTGMIKQLILIYMKKVNKMACFEILILLPSRSVKIHISDEMYNVHCEKSSPAMKVIWKENIKCDDININNLPYLIVLLNSINQQPYLYIRSGISALHINICYLISPWPDHQGDDIVNYFHTGLQ